MEGGWLAVKAMFAASPELADANSKIEERFRRVLGTPFPRLADVGIAHDRGFALFAGADDTMLAVIPVVDRDRFVASAKGTRNGDTDTIKKVTCKVVRGYYACARPAALLDQLGKGDGSLRARFARAGARGDVEFAGVGSEDVKVMMSGAVQLGRGAFVLRG